MEILQTDRSKFLAIMIILILGLYSTTIFAQEKDETKSKLDNLKGKIEKLTINADGKDIVFEGKDAEKLVKMLKSSPHKEFMFQSHDGKMMKRGGGNVMMFRSEDNDADEKGNGDEKNVKVEVNDDGKKITVTTMKDGKEETKVYEGEDAEKFLKEEKGMKHFNIQIDGDEDMPKDHMVYFNRKMGNKKMSKHGCNCCGGGCGMEMAPMHGKTSHKMMMKMKSDGNDDDESDLMIEKKIEKKTEKK